MRADGVSTCLVLLLLIRLGGRANSSTARRPRPDGPQAQPRILLPCERSLSVLPQLLGVGQVADAGVELAEELFRLGVDLLLLSVSEVRRLRCLGGRVVSSRRGRCREVGLADASEVGVEGCDVGVLARRLASCSVSKQRLCKPTIRYASFKNSSMFLRDNVGSTVGRASWLFSSSLRTGVRSVIAATQGPVPLKELKAEAGMDFSLTAGERRGSGRIIWSNS